MKKVLCLAAMGAAVMAIGSGSAFAAGSSGKGQQPIEASCTTSGDVTVVASSGQSAWVNNAHYVVQSFTGTFTSGGQTVSFSKTYGKKSGFGESQECTGMTTDQNGNTFSFDVFVAPNPNGG